MNFFSRLWHFITDPRPVTYPPLLAKVEKRRVTMKRIGMRIDELRAQKR